MTALIGISGSSHHAGFNTAASVSALKQAVVAADGVPLVTAEYNNGIPGVFIVAVFVDAVWRSKR
jgi:NAD(P)H-dependent FMN reductase